MASRFTESVVEQAALVRCRTLATLRDTLLPKLLSGEIRVADAELVSRRNP